MLAESVPYNLAQATLAQVTSPARSGANLGSQLVRWAQANGLVVPLMVGAAIVLVALTVFVLKYKLALED